MNSQPPKLNLIKSDDKGETYQADGFKLLYRRKGSVAGDNDQNVEELMYLVSGEAEVIVGAESKNYIAPSVFMIPSRTQHQIKAVTDIVLVMVT